jgi:hypothetical protein
MWDHQNSGVALTLSPEATAEARRMSARFYIQLLEEKITEFMYGPSDSKKYWETSGIKLDYFEDVFAFTDPAQPCPPITNLERLLVTDISILPDAIYSAFVQWTCSLRSTGCQCLVLRVISGGPGS